MVVSDVGMGNNWAAPCKAGGHVVRRKLPVDGRALGRPNYWRLCDKTDVSELRTALANQCGRSYLCLWPAPRFLQVRSGQVRSGQVYYSAEV